MNNEFKNDLSVIRIDTNPYKTDTTIQKVEIEVFPLVPETHPALRKSLPQFNFTNPPVDPNKFASSLVETCRKHGALGLSANQCGYEHRVFVMGNDDSYVAFFNPRIIETSQNIDKMEEGCLTYPDLFLSVERPSEILVEYQDFTGETKQAKYTGLTARCFQHELDHLNGKVYTHLVKPLALQMAMKRRSKLIDKRRKLQKQLMEKTKHVSKQLAGLR
jgi:peptide deformylase